MKRKEAIVIGLSVAIDGATFPGSGKGNILGFSASGGEFTFSTNLQPINQLELREYWNKNNKHLQPLLKDQVKVEKGLEDFRKWLLDFKDLHPVITAKGWDYWWMYFYMRTYLGKCPLEETFIEARSFNLGSLRKGDDYHNPPSHGTIEEAQRLEKEVGKNVELGALQRVEKGKKVVEGKVIRLVKRGVVELDTPTAPTPNWTPYTDTLEGQLTTAANNLNQLATPTFNFDTQAMQNLRTRLNRATQTRATRRVNDALEVGELTYMPGEDVEF